MIDEQNAQVKLEQLSQAEERAWLLKTDDDLVNHFLDQAGIGEGTETFARVNQLIHERDWLRKRLKQIHSRSGRGGGIDDGWSLVRDIRQLSELE